MARSSIVQRWMRERNMSKGHLRAAMNQVDRMLTLNVLSSGEVRELERVSSIMHCIYEGWNPEYETAKMQCLHTKSALQAMLSKPRPSHQEEKSI